MSFKALDPPARFPEQVPRTHTRGRGRAVLFWRIVPAIPFQGRIHKADDLDVFRPPVAKVAKEYRFTALRRFGGTVFSVNIITEVYKHFA